jgi:hypothetical protein
VHDILTLDVMAARLGVMVAGTRRQRS